MQHVKNWEQTTIVAFITICIYRQPYPVWLPHFRCTLSSFFCMWVSRDSRLLNAVINTFLHQKTYIFGCPVDSMVSARVSHQYDPGSIPGVPTRDETWSLSRSSRIGGFSRGTPVLPQRTTYNLACRHLESNPDRMRERPERYPGKITEMHPFMPNETDLWYYAISCPKNRCRIKFKYTL